MVRRTISVVASLALATTGCASTGIARVDDPPRPFASRQSTVLLRDGEGRSLPVTPRSTVRFLAKDGSATRRAAAGSLCVANGAFLLRPSSADGCENAVPWIAFNDIERVWVENADQAGVVALATGVVAVVATVVVVVVALAADDEKQRSSSSSSSSSGAPSGSTPSGGLPSFDSTPLSEVPEHKTTYRAFAPAARLALDLAESAAATEWAERHEAAPAEETYPVFSPVETRRARLQWLVSVDGALDLGGASRGLTTAAKLGVRLVDFVDLQAGARLLHASRVEEAPRAFPVVGVGLHGRFPRARWAALSLSIEGGKSAAVDLYFSATPGVRFAPLSRLWIGIYPLYPAYAAWSAGRPSLWAALSSVDVTLAF